MKKCLIAALLFLGVNACFANSAGQTIIINNYNNNSYAYSPLSYGNCSRGLALYGNMIIASTRTIYAPSRRKSDIKAGKRQQYICN